MTSSPLSLAVRLNDAFRAAGTSASDAQSGAVAHLKRVSEEYARERYGLNAPLGDTLARIAALHQVTFGSGAEFAWILEQTNGWVTFVYDSERAARGQTPESARAVGSPIVLVDHTLRAFARRPQELESATALWKATIALVAEQRRAGRPLHRVQERLEAMARLSVPPGENLQRVLGWMREWSSDVFRSRP